VIGIASPAALLWYAFAAVPFWGLNWFIGNGLLYAEDLGGSIFIWTFGAVFGLSFGYIYNYKKLEHAKNRSQDMASSYQSDLTSLLGTIFLWVLWPSFNSAEAPTGTSDRVVVNTVLSLCSSVIFTFVFSRIFRGGLFRMSDIQRASLAGGVAMASISSFLISPGGAIVTGGVAGAVSCLTLVFLSPLVESKGLHDSLSVLSSWGIPGIIGAITGIISAGIASSKDTTFGQTMQQLFPHRGNDQAGWNLIALLITLAIAAFGGSICAIIATLVDRFILSRFSQTDDQVMVYTDERDWVVPSDFELTSVKKSSSKKMNN